MDKAVLKKFAIESRQDLMQRMENKIKTFYIDEEFSKQQSGDVYILANSKHSLNLSKEEYTKRELLIKRINELGLDQVIEEAAYTWFNRIVAIRYMEIHDYLPLTKDNQSLGLRVLSSKDNTPNPEIMKISNLLNPDLDIEFNKEYYGTIQDNNKRFEYILLLVCKKLGKVIPQVFDGITDYIDILIPDNLLNESGYITKVLKDVPIINFEKVEIIGWLYQYYNQSEKDRVMGESRVYETNEIPYVTQLFTPDWIVKYLVENSLGKYLIEKTGKSDLVNNFNYYIDENINQLEDSKKNIKDIKLLDPCCGSGHILVYAFEVLFKAYQKEGYMTNEIAYNILKNNIYGLDIDYRATQLTILALLLKAKEYDKNILNKINSSELNITTIDEVKEDSDLNFMDLNDNNRDKLNNLIKMFRDAKSIGSLIKVDNTNFDDLESYIENDDSMYSLPLKNKILPLIKQANMLKSKYDVVVTNPPYLNNSNMNVELKEYVNKNYPKSKSDMFAAFIEASKRLSRKEGYVAMITIQVWMFTSSFEEFRKELINTSTICSMLHIGFNTFPELNSKFALGTAFVISNNCDMNYNGIFYNLNVENTSANKELIFLEKKRKNEKFLSNNNRYLSIDGNPIAYWISDEIINTFKNYKRVNDIAQPRQGLATGENKRFIRLWHEVDFNKIGKGCRSIKESEESKKKWFPYNKGGDFRKWYGNNNYVVNWENDGFEIRNFKSDKGKIRSRAQNTEFYFKKGITWSFVNLVFGCRYVDSGYIFDVGGSSVFPEDRINYYMLAFLNSKIAQEYLKILNPSLNFQVGNIASLPFKFDESREKEINDLVKENIQLVKKDWDSSETSIDFIRNNVIDNAKETIEETVNFIIQQQEIDFNKLKENEEKLNKIFFDIYNIHDFDFKIDEKYISFRKQSKIQLIKDLISYSVGCMFGRYSLDVDGLVYAGGDFEKNNYNKLMPDIDNIIPINEENYFNDDIFTRFKDFIKIVFGENKLYDNLEYIAEAIGKNNGESSEETLRRYFINDFYEDHCQTYSVTGSGKKPIYWLLDSGKKNGFKALIYMHRYNENLIPKARLDYLHRVQTTYEKLLSDVNYKLTTELSMVDKKDAQKRQTDLNAKLQEIKEYDEKIAHIANQRISIDLDDGIKVNYEKFKDILAKIR